MPFLLAEILNFQGLAHLIGVGSFSYLRIHADMVLLSPYHVALSQPQYLIFCIILDL